MKNWRLILLIVVGLAGVGIMIWGNVIMMRFEGFREIWRAARNAAMPQFIVGLVLMLIAYGLTFSDKTFK